MDWFCGCFPKKKENNAIQGYRPINTPKSGQEISIGRASPSQASRDTSRIKPIELPSKDNGYVSIADLRKDAPGTTVFRKIQKSDYEKIKAECERTKTKYTDPSFLCEKNVFIKEWKRLPEILPNATFMKYPIRPSNILQGQINDCYWMSAVASIAERDYRIINIFGALELSPYGVYMCRLTSNGVYQEIVVDDYFPVDNEGKLVYARPYMGTDCWSIILEKCWAKIFGSYHKTNFGFNCEALYALSGAPVKILELANFKTDFMGYQTLFRTMQKHEEENHVTTCSIQTKNNIKQEMFIQVGHAYSILGAFKTILNGHEIQLIQLRNPLGNSGVARLVNGQSVRAKTPCIPYNTDDKFWKLVSEEEKKRLQFWMIEKPGDGVFYMDLMQFALLYDEVAICEINDNAHYIWETATFADCQARYVNLRVGMPTDKFYLILAQKNRRRIVESDTLINQKARYASISVLVAKVEIGPDNKEKFIYVSSRSYNHTLATNYFPADLGINEGGHYLVRIYVQIQNQKEEKIELTVGYYSPDDFEASFLDKIDDTQFLHRTLLYRARKLDLDQKTPLPNASGWRCIENIPGSSLCYIAYRIDSISNYNYKKYRITVDERENKSNVYFLGDHQGEQDFQVEVACGNEVIFVYMYTDMLPDPELVPDVKDDRQLPNPTFLPIQ